MSGQGTLALSGAADENHFHKENHEFPFSNETTFFRDNLESNLSNSSNDIERLEGNIFPEIADFLYENNAGDKSMSEVHVKYAIDNNLPHGDIDNIGEISGSGYRIWNKTHGVWLNGYYTPVETSEDFGETIDLLSVNSHIQQKGATLVHCINADHGIAGYSSATAKIISAVPNFRHIAPQAQSIDDKNNYDTGEVVVLLECYDNEGKSVYKKAKKVHLKYHNDERGSIFVEGYVPKDHFFKGGTIESNYIGESTQDDIPVFEPAMIKVTRKNDPYKTPTLLDVFKEQLFQE